RFGKEPGVVDPGRAGGVEPPVAGGGEVEPVVVRAAGLADAPAPDAVEPGRFGDPAPVLLESLAGAPLGRSGEAACGLELALFATRSRSAPVTPADDGPAAGVPVDDPVVLDIEPGAIAFDDGAVPDAGGIAFGADLMDPAGDVGAFDAPAIAFSAFTAS